MISNLCFCCDKKIGNSFNWAYTNDGQSVFVGIQCFKKIKKSGEIGYQPPLGGPKLYLWPVEGVHYPCIDKPEGL